MRSLSKIIDDLENVKEWKSKDREIKLILRDVINNLEFIEEKRLGVFLDE